MLSSPTKSEDQDQDYAHQSEEEDDKQYVDEVDDPVFDQQRNRNSGQKRENIQQQF